jgi:hypothetical protein
MVRNGRLIVLGHSLAKLSAGHNEAGIGDSRRTTRVRATKSAAPEKDR